MCTVSMIGDHFHDKWTDPWPYQTIPAPLAPTVTISPHYPPEVTKAEFEKLRQEVLEMKALLKRAKLYDEKNGEPDCEIEDKMELLRRVAKAVGVDLDDVLQNSGASG